MLSGDFFRLLPLGANLVQRAMGHLHPTSVGQSVHNFAFGLPSWGWMLPREGVLGINTVSWWESVCAQGFNVQGV